MIYYYIISNQYEITYRHIRCIFYLHINKNYKSPFNHVSSINVDFLIRYSFNYMFRYCIHDEDKQKINVLNILLSTYINTYFEVYNQKKLYIYIYILENTNGTIRFYQTKYMN